MIWLPKSVVCLSYYDARRFRSDLFAALILSLQLFPLAHRHRNCIIQLSFVQFLMVLVPCAFFHDNLIGAKLSLKLIEFGSNSRQPQEKVEDHRCGHPTRSVNELQRELNLS